MILGCYHYLNLQNSILYEALGPASERIISTLSKWVCKRFDSRKRTLRGRNADEEDMRKEQYNIHAELAKNWKTKGKLCFVWLWELSGVCVTWHSSLTQESDVESAQFKAQGWGWQDIEKLLQQQWVLQPGNIWVRSQCVFKSCAAVFEITQVNLAASESWMFPSPVAHCVSCAFFDDLLKRRL